MIQTHRLFRIAAVVVLLASAMTMTTAMAQSANQSETSSHTDRVVRAIDDETVVSDYSYDESDEQFTINITTDSRFTRGVTVMEAISGNDVQSLNIRDVAVRSGSKTTVVIEARQNRQGAAGVVLTSEPGIEQGRAAVIITESQTSLPETNLGFGVATGIITMILGAGIAYHRRYSVSYKQILDGWKQ